MKSQNIKRPQDQRDGEKQRKGGRKESQVASLTHLIYAPRTFAHSILSPEYYG